jgi:hypothetical protein
MKTKVETNMNTKVWKPKIKTKVKTKIETNMKTKVETKMKSKIETKMKTEIETNMDSKMMHCIASSFLCAPVHWQAKAESSKPKESLLSLLVNNVLKNPFIWGMAFTYFFIYVVRQGVTSWFIFYLIKVPLPPSVIEGISNGQPSITNAAMLLPTACWYCGCCWQVVVGVLSSLFQHIASGLCHQVVKLSKHASDMPISGHGQASVMVTVY